MQFGSPEWLYALWLVPLMAALFHVAARRRRAALERFADPPLLDTVAPGARARPRYRRASALIAATALLIVALSQPKWGYHWEEVHRSGVDIVIAIDTSKSMLAEDLAPNRLGRAKLAVRDLLDMLPGDRIGLVAFAGSAFVECPLTLDYGFAKMILNDIDVDTIPYGGTNVGLAIRKSLDAFEDKRKEHKVVVVITDGENLEGDPIAAAEEARTMGVKIHAVGVGSTAGSLIPVEVDGQRRYLRDSSGSPVNSRVDKITLEKICQTTGGKYTSASGVGDPLVALYDAVIAPMEERALGMSRIKRYEHRYQWPLAVALLLLLAEQGFIGNLLKWLVRRFRPATVVLVTMAALGMFPAEAEPVHKKVRAGNRLYEAGEYLQAHERYTDAQVDAPEMKELDFNVGDTLYKQRKYEDAIAAYSRATESVRPEVEAGAQYNIGNCKYMLGEQQGSIELMREAIDEYRQALSLDPDDVDAKFNIEFVQRRIKELISQQQQQGQDQSEQEQEQDQSDQQQGQDQSEQEQEQEQEQSDQQQGQDQSEQEQTQAEQQQLSSEEQPEAGQPRDQRELSKEEAEAALRAFEQEEADARERSLQQMRAPARQPLKDW